MVGHGRQLLRIEAGQTVVRCSRARPSSCARPTRIGRGPPPPPPIMPLGTLPGDEAHFRTPNTNFLRERGSRLVLAGGGENRCAKPKSLGRRLHPGGLGADRPEPSCRRLLSTPGDGMLATLTHPPLPPWHGSAICGWVPSGGWYDSFQGVAWKSVGHAHSVVRLAAGRPCARPEHLPCSSEGAGAARGIPVL